MRIEVELTNDQFFLLTFELGQIAGHYLMEADECKDDPKKREHLRKRSNRVHELYQFIQAGVKP